MAIKTNKGPEGDPKAGEEKQEEKQEEKSKEEESTEEVEESEEKSSETSEGDPKAHIAKLNEENKKHRLQAKKAQQENRELKEQQAKMAKALAILQGKEEPALDPVLKAKAESEAKMRRTLLKAELASVAKDAHDSSVLFKAHSDFFSDVEVDLDNESVDRDALEEKVGELRKKSPWLFSTGNKEDSTTNTKVKNPPDKGPQSKAGTAYSTWQAMLKSGDRSGATAFYNKNRDQILPFVK